jgi:hypothetical protein
MWNSKNLFTRRRRGHEEEIQEFTKSKREKEEASKPAE